MLQRASRNSPRSTEDRFVPSSSTDLAQSATVVENCVGLTSSALTWKKLEEKTAKEKEKNKHTVVRLDFLDDLMD